MTHRGTWKKAERTAASIFGVKRRALSGSNDGSGCSDDARHPVLYIESKYRAKHTVWSLWEETKESAIIEGKGRVPVIVLKQKGKIGNLLCVNTRDLEKMVVEYVKANPEVRTKFDT